MNKPKKVPSASSSKNRKGRPKVKKPKTPSLIRYEELLKRMKALNLPPMDIVADEQRIRAAEGF